MIDAWLDERHNFSEDRKAADEIEQRWPGTARKIAEARGFVMRAVTYAARQGIAQYLVTGPGMPGRPDVHDTARAIIPGAKAVYADLDPFVIAYHRAGDEGDPGVTSVEAAPLFPAAVAAHPGVRALLRLDEPVCVVWAWGAMFATGAAAREVVSGWTRLLAPGSCLILFAAVPVDEQAAELAKVFEHQTGDRVHGHTAAEIAGWVEGLDVTEPRVADVRSWRAGMPDPRLAPRPVFRILGAVARVPEGRPAFQG